MSGYLGSTAIGEMYYGSTKIGQAYLGSTLVYQSTPPTINYIFRDLDANGVLSTATGALENASSIKIVDTDYLFYCAFYSCSGLTGEAGFPSLTTISGSEGCYSMFRDCTNLTSASFPNLTTISGSEGCRYMFYGCTSLTTLSFPSLKTISGSEACYYMFYNCTNLTTASFPSLTTISGSEGCCRMFQSCSSLEHIYFNSLTTSSFGSYTNQFNNMMGSTGTTKTHTIHFPSNMETTISGLEGYPLFGGSSGYVVLSFDLPETS